MLLWKHPVHLLGGGSVGSPTRGTPGTHSAGLSNSGIPQGLGLRRDGAAQYGSHKPGCPEDAQPSIGARQVPRGGGSWEGTGGPYRSTPPSGSGDTWAWCRLGWARHSARTGSGMLHAGPAEVTARPPRPAPPSAAQMCAPPRPDVRPVRSWRRPPGARPCQGCRDGALHPFQPYTSRTLQSLHLHPLSPLPDHSPTAPAARAPLPPHTAPPLCSPAPAHACAVWGAESPAQSRSCDWHLSINHTPRFMGCCPLRARIRFSPKRV